MYADHAGARSRGRAQVASGKSGQLDRDQKWREQVKSKQNEKESNVESKKQSSSFSAIGIIPRSAIKASEVNIY